jgi:Ice-binding-like
MNKFENITKPLMWSMTLLLAAVVAGCGGGDGGSGAGGHGPARVNLKSISTNNFVILATTAITEATPVNGHITGNIGSSGAGSAISVTCAEMVGSSKIHPSDAGYTGSGDTSCAVPTSTLVGPAVLDLGTAYTAASAPATPAGTGAAHLNLLGGNIPAGTTFAPGTYTWDTPGDVNINGDITLTGGPNDVWIFQMSGNLAFASCGSCSSAADTAAIQVKVSGGAVASNVFWQVAGASATLGTYSTFTGTLLTSPSTLIAIQTGSLVNGRVLSGTSVALDGNRVGP